MKYVPQCKNTKQKGDSKKGRYVDPNSWITGPDPFVREKYYAFLKHRSQAQYRGEDYQLTWEDWQTIWTDERFNKRGRKIDDLVLCRDDWNGVWTLNNCVIITRAEHFKKRSEYQRGKK